MSRAQTHSWLANCFKAKIRLSLSVCLCSCCAALFSSSSAWRSNSIAAVCSLKCAQKQTGYQATSFMNHPQPNPLRLVKLDVRWHKQKQCSSPVFETTSTLLRDLHPRGAARNMDGAHPQLSLLLLLQTLSGNLISNEVDDGVWPEKLSPCGTAMHACWRRIALTLYSHPSRVLQASPRKACARRWQCPWIDTARNKT